MNEKTVVLDDIVVLRTFYKLSAKYRFKENGIFFMLLSVHLLIVALSRQLDLTVMYACAPGRSPVAKSIPTFAIFAAHPRSQNAGVTCYLL